MSFSMLLKQEMRKSLSQRNRIAEKLLRKMKHKHWYLIHTWPAKLLRVPLPSVHWGFLEITLTVHLKLLFWKFNMKGLLHGFWTRVQPDAQRGNIPWRGRKGGIDICYILKGVFAKNGRGYRFNAIKKRVWLLLILLLSVASTIRENC